LAERGRFYFYFEWSTILQLFDDNEAIEILYAILEFAEYGEHTTFKDKRQQLTFDRIAKQMAADKEEYDKKCIQNAKNGKLGGRPSKSNSTADILFD